MLTNPILRITNIYISISKQPINQNSLDSMAAAANLSDLN